MQATKHQSYAALPNYNTAQPNRIAQPYRQPTRRSVPQRQPRTFSKWDRVSIVGCIVACAMVFWGLAAANAHITAVNRSIDKLTVQTQKVSAENSSLTEQIDSLSDPQNVLKAVSKNETYQNTIVIPSGK